MEKRIYHGSDKIIMHPSADFRNTSNDYGSGFYLTESASLAGEWACRKNKDGFINHYVLDMDNLCVCNLNSEKYHILNWLALLTKHRGYWQKHSISEQAKEYLQEKYLPDLTETDVIIGYRADDSYFSFASDFVAGTISLQVLAEAMKLGKLGEQIVLKSRKAFEKIKYIDNERATADIFYRIKYERDLAARRDYAKAKRRDMLNDIYMLDIMRGRVSEDELRL